MRVKPTDKTVNQTITNPNRKQRRKAHKNLKKFLYRQKLEKREKEGVVERPTFNTLQYKERRKISLTLEDWLPADDELCVLSCLEKLKLVDDSLSITYRTEKPDIQTMASSAWFITKAILVQSEDEKDRYNTLQDLSNVIVDEPDLEFCVHLEKEIYEAEYQRQVKVAQDKQKHVDKEGIKDVKIPEPIHTPFSSRWHKVNGYYVNLSKALEIKMPHEDLPFEPFFEASKKLRRKVKHVIEKEFASTPFILVDLRREEDQMRESILNTIPSIFPVNVVTIEQLNSLRPKLNLGYEIDDEEDDLILFGLTISHPNCVAFIGNNGELPTTAWAVGQKNMILLYDGQVIPWDSPRTENTIVLPINQMTDEQILEQIPHVLKSLQSNMLQ